MTHTPSDYDPPTFATGASPDDPRTGVDDLDTGAAYPRTRGEYLDTGGASTSSTDAGSVADVAKGEAANVKDTAVEAGKNVAATAKDEAANVVADTKAQAKSMLGSVTSEVQGQAGSQQQKIAAGVQSLSQELTGMASGSQESGPLTDLVQQAGQKGGEVARWLEDREPRDVLAEVKSFARRRPVTFLALCGLAGVVAGRLTRGAVAANTSIDSPSNTSLDSPSNTSLDSSSKTSVDSSSNYATPSRGVESGRPASLVPESEVSPATPLYDEVLTANPALAGTTDQGQAGTGVGSQGERTGGMR